MPGHGDVDLRLDLLRHSLSRRGLLKGSSALLGGFALSGLLAACGSDDDDDDDGDGGGTSTTPEATSATGGATSATGGATTPAESSPESTETTDEGEGGGGGQPGGTLIIAFDADPESLDPHVTTALLASRVLAFMHDQLVVRDYDEQYVGDLADEWEVSEDGLTYTFTLKSGVTFHSGKAMTSADVKWTFERWLATEASPTSYTIEPIDTIETPDDTTVVFHMKEPYNIFLDQLSGGWSVILNQEAVEAAGDTYGVDTVDGTGPFKFDSWTRNQALKLTRFDDYTWGSSIFDNQGPAYVEAAEVRVIPEANTAIAEFESGNVHLVASVPPVEVDRLSNSSGVEIVKFDQLQTTYFGMNTTKAPVDTVEVRKAIGYAIDRESIVEGAYFGLGTPALTMLHPNTPSFSQEALDAAPHFDPDQARSILEDAGWTEGDGGVREKDGQKLVVPFWVINDDATVLQAQILEEQLADIGVQLETQQYEQTAWFEAARSGNQTAYTVGVFYSTADVLYFYFFSEQTPAPNRFFYNNPDVDGWLTDSRSNPDDAAVEEDYANIQMQLSEDYPAAPLIHQIGTLGKLDSVQGVKVHSSRWLYRLLDISLEQD
jgi:peptide/nickel transport system substrate-binding protein